MSFFERNRAALAERGIDPARLPPGQYSTERCPVLHVGDVPTYAPDRSDWSLTVGGLVATPRTFSWTELLALPATGIVTDIHCVTKWSKFDMPWKGVPFDEVIKLVELGADATHVMCHSEFGFTANIPLEDCTGVDDKGQPRAMLAYQYDGDALEPEHGYPLRFFLPHLYFWKSAKWLRGLEFMAGDRPGFWERNGYHMYGDPFRELRHTGDR